MLAPRLTARRHPQSPGKSGAESAVLILIGRAITWAGWLDQVRTQPSILNGYTRPSRLADTLDSVCPEAHVLNRLSFDCRWFTRTCRWKSTFAVKSNRQFRQ